MADLNAAGGGELAAALNAFITGAGNGDISHDIRLKVAGVIDIFKRGSRLVPPSHEISARRHGVVGDNLNTLKPYRRGRTGDNTGGDDFIFSCQAKVGAAPLVPSLG